MLICCFTHPWKSSSRYTLTGMANLIVLPKLSCHTDAYAPACLPIPLEHEAPHVCSAAPFLLCSRVCLHAIRLQWLAGQREQELLRSERHAGSCAPACLLPQQGSEAPQVCSAPALLLCLFAAPCPCRHLTAEISRHAGLQCLHLFHAMCIAWLQRCNRVPTYSLGDVAWLLGCACMQLLLESAKWHAALITVSRQFCCLTDWGHKGLPKEAEAVFLCSRVETSKISSSLS